MSASRTSRSRIASRTSSQVDLRSQVERIAASLAIAVLHARVHNPSSLLQRTSLNTEPRTPNPERSTRTQGRGREEGSGQGAEGR